MEWVWQTLQSSYKLLLGRLLMRSIHVDSPSPLVFVKISLTDLVLLQSRLCFTEYSSCQMVLRWIPWPAEKSGGQGGDFLPLLHSAFSTPPNIYMHASTHTRMLMLRALLLFLQGSCAHMVLHRLGSCSAYLRASAHVFNIQFFKNSGLDEHLQRHLCPCNCLLRILKGTTVRGSIPIFLCSSSAEAKIACQIDGKKIKAETKSVILWIR